MNTADAGAAGTVAGLVIGAMLGGAIVAGASPGLMATIAVVLLLITGWMWIKRR